jgi:hypothetical protein
MLLIAKEWFIPSKVMKHFPKDISRSHNSNEFVEERQTTTCIVKNPN